LLGEKSPIFDLEHTFLYSAKTIRKLFEKNNFKVDFTDKPFNILSVRHLIWLLPLPTFIKEKLLKQNLPFFKINFKIPLGNLSIVARKREEFSAEQKRLRKRLAEIIYKAKASHMGSALSVIDLIDSIYSIKSKKDRFVLSNGHAASAYYVVLEKFGYLKDIDLNKLGVHPDRNPKMGIDVSTGSLGQGLPIALGMALANPKTNVYCLISDGEAAEGSIWESLRVYQEQVPKNLKIIISVNGWGAYDPISSKNLEKRLKGFGLDVIKMNGHNPQEIISLLKKEYDGPTIYFAQTNSEQLPFLRGLTAHYHSMSEEDYQLALKIFS